MQYVHWLLAAFALYWLAWAIRPRDRGVWWMENSFTIVTVAALAFTYPYWPLSDLSYTLISLLLAIHTIGGSYRYGHVPYVEWIRRVFGKRIANRIRTKRNHYDRVVHFAFGLLVAYPMHDLLVRYAHPTGAWTYILAGSLIIALSAIFELIEWAAAVLMAPAQGIEYLGAQGDIWDAQADMALATAGAIIALAVTALL